eukprot:TRINITY_DN8161_c0_g3_i1.p1 TRINITY_DN8161_c0_g3~~TRINITY_DN8161_c0_g3_i1.p1  ORF type:complete len:168 (-),score=16.14 TRINITY_DN8161_c0_g3_i1:110-613(-)
MCWLWSIAPVFVCVDVDGNVASLIRSYKEKGMKCPEYEVKQYIAEASQGLAYLQLKGLAHGDVRPENLLLDADGKIKLAGYCLDPEILKGESAHYKSPEVCGGGEGTTASDVWSLGCVAYELCAFTVTLRRTCRKPSTEQPPKKSPAKCVTCSISPRPSPKIPIATN